VLTTLRAALAVGLLAGLYVLAFVLVLADLTMLLAPLIAVPSQVETYTNAINLARLSAPPVLAVLVGLFAVSRRAGGSRPSVLLDPADAPALCALVAGLAAEVGTAPPTEVRLTAEANAQVSEDARLLGLVPGTRRLYLGLPLLLGLSTGELRAVLGHELGHYARRHTRIGAVTYRGAVALEQIQHELDGLPGRRRRFDVVAAILRRIYRGYARLYLSLSFAMRRRQELEADAAAVAVAGPAAAVAALRSSHAIAVAWADFLGRFASTARAEGFIPGGLFDAFADMLADPLAGDVLARLRATVPEPERAPLDSHPSLADRLRRIEAAQARHPGHEAAPGPSGPGERAAATRPPGHDLTPAARLLADAGPVFGAVADLVFPADSGAPVLPWPDWADLVADALAVAAATELIEAARRVAVQPEPTLGSVLDLLETGEAGRLAAALTRTGPAGSAPAGPEQPDPRRKLRGGLAALVGCLLVQAGYASWKLAWTGPSTLVGLDIAVVEFPSLVDAAVRSPAQVGNLRSSLAYLDVAVDVPPELGRITVPGLAGAAGLAAAAGARGHRAGPGPAAPSGTRRELLITFNIGFMVVCLIVGAVTLDHHVHADSAAYPFPVSSYPGNRYSPGALLPTSPAQFGLPTQDLPGLMPVPTLPPLWITIVVAPGDTLSGLACRYGSTVRQLQQVNGLGRSSQIEAGQQLRVPALPDRRTSCRAIR
jgi:Zn-dependent protease with chaperone function